MVSRLLFALFRLRFWWQYRRMQKRAKQTLARRAKRAPEAFVTPQSLQSQRVVQVPANRQWQLAQQITAVYMPEHLPD